MSGFHRDGGRGAAAAATGAAGGGLWRGHKQFVSLDRTPLLDPDAPATAAVIKQRLDDVATVSAVFHQTIVLLHLWRCVVATLLVAAFSAGLFTLWRLSLVDLLRWVWPWASAPDDGSYLSWFQVLWSTSCVTAAALAVLFARYHVLTVHRRVYCDVIQLVRSTFLPSRVFLHVVEALAGLFVAATLLGTSPYDHRVTQACAAAMPPPTSSGGGPEPGESAVWLFSEVVVGQDAPRMCLNGEAVLSVTAAALAGIVSSYRCLLYEEHLIRVPSVLPSPWVRIVNSLPDMARQTARTSIVVAALMLPLVSWCGASLITLFDAVWTRLDGFDAHIDYQDRTTWTALMSLYLTSLPQVLRVSSLVVATNQAVRYVLDIVFTTPVNCLGLAKGDFLLRQPRAHGGTRIHVYGDSGEWRLNTHLLRMRGLELVSQGTLAQFLLSWHAWSPRSAFAAHTTGSRESATHRIGRCLVFFIGGCVLAAAGLGLTAGLLTGTALSMSVLLDQRVAMASFTPGDEGEGAGHGTSGGGGATRLFPEQGRVVFWLRVASGALLGMSAASVVGFSYWGTTVCAFVLALVVLLAFEEGQSVRLATGVVFGLVFGLLLSVPMGLMVSLTFGLRFGVGCGLMLGAMMVLGDGQLSRAMSVQTLRPQFPAGQELGQRGGDGNGNGTGNGNGNSTGNVPANNGWRSRQKNEQPFAHPLERRRVPAGLGNEDGNAHGDGYGYAQHPDLDLSGSVYRPLTRNQRIENFLDRPPTRAEAQVLNQLAGVAKQSEVAAYESSSAMSVAWDEQALMQEWKTRLQLAEAELYAGRATTISDSLPFWLAAYRSLLFVSVVDAAARSPEQRYDVFRDPSGRAWLELLWTCTSRIDALSITLQAASASGVAPKAARYKTPFARRGGHMLCFGFMNECKPYDPVVEQARWLKGGLKRAQRRWSSVMDLMEDNGTDLDSFEHRFASQHSSARAYQTFRGGATDGGSLWRPSAAAEKKAQREAKRSRYLPLTGGRFGVRMRSAESAVDDGDYGGDDGGGDDSGIPQDTLFRPAWFSSDDDASNYGLLRHVVVRCRRSASQKSRALFDDAHAVCCAADTLSLFAAASLQEDEFGVVQHTLPVVVASLVLCLSSVEAYVKSPAFRGGDTLPAYMELNGVTRPHPTAVRIVLEQALLRLVSAFDRHLRRVSLPKPLKTRLEALMAAANNGKTGTSGPGRGPPSTHT